MMKTVETLDLHRWMLWYPMYKDNLVSLTSGFYWTISQTCTYSLTRNFRPTYATTVRSKVYSTIWYYPMGDAQQTTDLLCTGVTGQHLYLHPKKLVYSDVKDHTLTILVTRL